MRLTIRSILAPANRHHSVVVIRRERPVSYASTPSETDLAPPEQELSTSDEVSQMEFLHDILHEPERRIRRTRGAWTDVSEGWTRRRLQAHLPRCFSTVRRR